MSASPLLSLRTADQEEPLSNQTSIVSEPLVKSSAWDFSEGGSNSEVGSFHQQWDPFS